MRRACRRAARCSKPACRGTSADSRKACSTFPTSRRASHELAEFLVAACDEYDLDRTRLWAVGFSNGANIAASVMLLTPGLLRGGILLSPMTPFTPEPLPDLSGTEVWIGSGRHDPIAPPAEVEQLSAMLKHAHADVTLHWTEGAHGVDAREIEAARVWLEERAHR
jgi:predicted esterase